MLIQLQKDNLEEVLSQEGDTFIQFATKWCGSCIMMKKRFVKLAELSEETQFILVNVERNPNAVKLANLKALPFFTHFKNGNLLKEIQTTNPIDLKAFILKELNL